MKPLVSICIPAYNGERWLRECLDSALACTADCEIMLVDDGSSDATVAIAKSYAEKDARVSVHVNPQNLGLARNWNRCLELAKGEWIKFLFQDDVLGTDAVEKMLGAAAGNTSFIAARRHFIFDEASSAEARKYYTETVLTLDKLAPGTIVFSPAQIVALSAAHPAVNFIGEPSTVMFRRSLIAAHGTFDPELRQICDLEYWLRIGSKDGLIYVPEAQIDFRIHETSVSALNAGGKKYVSSYLDPLRVVDAQLHSPAYESFRNYLSASDKQRLTLWLRMRAHEAKLAAADDVSKKELEKLFAERPGLRALANKFLNGLLYRFLLLRRGKS